MDKKKELITSFKELKSEDRQEVYLKGAFFNYEDHYYPINLVFVVGDPPPIQVRKMWNYGKLLTIEDKIKGAEFLKFLESLESDKDVSLLSYPLRFSQGHVVDPNEDQNEVMKRVGFFIALNDTERSLLTETRSSPRSLLRKWPSRLFMFRHQPDGDCQGAFSRESFKPLSIKRDLPAFPDYHSALNNWWSGTEVSYLSPWTVLFSFPRSKAMISSVRYGKNKFVVDVSSQERNKEDFVCKYYVEYESTRSDAGELNLKDSNTISVSGDVTRLYLVLFEVRGAEDVLVDYRDFNWRSPFGAIRELAPEYDEETVDDLLSSKEGKKLEFKLEIVKDRESEFLETICAFSNSLGGSVLLGVDNDGNVRGLNERQLEAYRQKIIDLVRAWIEPKVSCELSIITYKKKAILAVEVPKGLSTPYNYKDHGIYIRVADRDRLATVDEVVALTKRTGNLYYDLN